MSDQPLRDVFLRLIFGSSSNGIEHIPANGTRNLATAGPDQTYISEGAATVNLPAAAANKGRRVCFVPATNGTTTTVNTDPADLIDVLGTPGVRNTTSAFNVNSLTGLTMLGVTFQSDGIQTWRVIDNYVQNPPA